MLPSHGKNKSPRRRRTRLKLVFFFAKINRRERPNVGQVHVSLTDQHPACWTLTTFQNCRVTAFCQQGDDKINDSQIWLVA